MWRSPPSTRVRPGVHTRHPPATRPTDVVCSWCMCRLCCRHRQGTQGWDEAVGRIDSAAAAGMYRYPPPPLPTTLTLPSPTDSHPVFASHDQARDLAHPPHTAAAVKVWPSGSVARPRENDVPGARDPTTRAAGTWSRPNRVRVREEKGQLRGMHRSQSRSVSMCAQETARSRGTMQKCEVRFGLFLERSTSTPVPPQQGSDSAMRREGKQRGAAGGVSTTPVPHR